MKIGVYVRSRDEENIIEFMDHYYNLGFDYILFLDHMSEIPIKEKIGDIFSQEKFSVLRFEMENEFLNSKDFFTENILPTIKEKMDYCLYVDMDEYLFINNNLKIKEILKNYLPFNMLKINWLFFGNNGNKTIKYSTLKNNYTKSSNKFNNHVKSLIKVSEIDFTYNSHFFVLKNKNLIKNVLNEVSNEGPFDCSLKEYSKNIPMYLAHYVVQSTKQFLIRRYTRKTRNLKLLNLNNEDEFINFLKQNQDLITDYLYSKNNELLDNIYNNIENNKYLMFENISELKKFFIEIKQFYQSHNCNIIENFDLL